MTRAKKSKQVYHGFPRSAFTVAGVEAGPTPELKRIAGYLGGTGARVPGARSSDEDPVLAASSRGPVTNYYPENEAGDSSPQQLLQHHRAQLCRRLIQKNLKSLRLHRQLLCLYAEAWIKLKPASVAMFEFLA